MPAVTQATEFVRGPLDGARMMITPDPQGLPDRIAIYTGGGRQTYILADGKYVWFSTVAVGPVRGRCRLCEGVLFSVEGMIYRCAAGCPGTA